MINKNAPFLSRLEIMDAQETFKGIQHLFNHMVDNHYGSNDLHNYLHTFQARICDQIAVEHYLLRDNEVPADILSIGGWPGIAALALQKSGHKTTVLDHPSVMAPIQAFYRGNGIFCISHDLGCKWTESVLDAKQFDLIECCQCIEHWNFNPIPIVQGLLKALKPNGILYMTVPNAVSLFRRLSHLFGRTPYPGMDCFEAQMNPSLNAEVSPHWREYTKDDLQRLIHASGGQTERCWHQFHSIASPNLIRQLYYLALHAVPSLQEGLGIIATNSKSV